MPSAIPSSSDSTKLRASAYIASKTEPIQLGSFTRRKVPTYHPRALARCSTSRVIEGNRTPVAWTTTTSFTIKLRPP